MDRIENICDPLMDAESEAELRHNFDKGYRWSDNFKLQDFDDHRLLQLIQDRFSEIQSTSCNDIYELSYIAYLCGRCMGSFASELLCRHPNLNGEELRIWLELSGD